MTKLQMYDRIIRDMPQQFHEKHNIDVFLKAIGKQLDQLEKMFNDLHEKTTLDTAVGKNLDDIGDIVVLSRKDAKNVLKDTSAKVIEDDVYRKALNWKILRNTCDCTYEDIMSSLKLIWDTDNITYYEDPNVPATVFIGMPTVGYDAIDPSVGRVLAIKPSGVAIVYNIAYTEVVNISALDEFIARLGYRLKLISVNDDYIELSVAHKTTMQNTEDISLTVRNQRNLWFLDGSFSLDGTRFLNAYLEQEEL